MGDSQTFSAALGGIVSATPQQETWFLIITPPAGISLSIKKISFILNQGVSPTTSDRMAIIWFKSLSVNPSGGTTLTPVKVNANASAPLSTVKHTVGVATGGTVSATIDRISLWRQINFAWYARDRDDDIVLKPGEMFGITGATQLANDAYCLDVVWSES